MMDLKNGEAMIYFIIGYCLMFLVFILVMIFSPEGWEDKNGFHRKDKK